MRLTHINEYDFKVWRENENYIENEEITFDIIKGNDYLDYFIHNKCKGRKISNTRCYYVNCTEERKGNKKPVETYYFHMVNIKKLLKKVTL